MRSTKYQLDYSLQDYNIVSDKNKIVCNVCPNVEPFAGYVDALGRWEISSFTGQLVRSHLRKRVLLRKARRPRLLFQSYPMFGMKKLRRPFFLNKL